VTTIENTRCRNRRFRQAQTGPRPLHCVWGGEARWRGRKRFFPVRWCADGVECWRRGTGHDSRRGRVVVLVKKVTLLKESLFLEGPSFSGIEPEVLFSAQKSTLLSLFAASFAAFVGRFWYIKVNFKGSNGAPCHVFACLFQFNRKTGPQQPRKNCGIENADISEIAEMEPMPPLQKSYKATREPRIFSVMF
jgi:hypothetical protein